MSQSLSPSSRNAAGFSVLRVLLCGLLMTALVAGCLYLHHTAFDFFRARMLDNGSKTIAWLTKQVSFALPFAVICLFHAAVYGGRDPRDGSVRREMFWEVAVVAALTYAVLLPYLSSVSEALHTNALAAGEKIPLSEGKVEITLLMELHEWFIRLTVPLALLLLYHGVRARRERFRPETEAEPAPLMTVAAYESQRAAARAAAEASERTAEAAKAETDGDTAEVPSIPQEEVSHEARKNCSLRRTGRRRYRRGRRCALYRDHDLGDRSP